MAESTWNNFIPKYVPNDLKWYEHDGLDTWYLQNKCNEFLQDTDLHFQQRQILNFDIIENGVSERTIKQYNQIDHEEIKKYPVKYQEQIMSSIFCAANRKDMIIQKKTIDEHFKKPPKSYGRGKFLKKFEMICMLHVGNL